jgi:predicted DNA-binding protein YlxM (UPF0122 family)
MYFSMFVPKIQEDYMKLKPDLREKYVCEKVKETLYMNKDGVSLTELATNLPFNRKTIEKCLERFVSVNEAYSKQYGVTKAYFPNSRAMHSLAELEIKDKEKTFRSVIIDNLLGQWVYIQEYNDTVYGKDVKGGIMVPLKDLDKFISFLNQTQEKLKVVKKDDN